MIVLALLGLAMGWFVPGYLVARRLEVRHTVLASYLLSLLLLFVVILLLQICGLPITFLTVVSCLLLASGLVLLFLPKVSPLQAATEVPAAAHREKGHDWPALVLTGFGVGVFVMRAIAQPLYGYDAHPRWSWLGQKIFEQQHLLYYPPFEPADYAHYIYCDGIPPLVQFNYFLVYAAFDRFAVGWTVLPALMQYGLAMLLAYRLANGLRAGHLALVLLSGSPLFLWALHMGQETGLTALGVGAMVLYLKDYAKRLDWQSCLLAGAGAAVAGLAREYCFAFVLMGGLYLLYRRAGKRALMAYSLPCFLATTWYLRNWGMTGNPLWPNNFFGLFPTNPVHDGILAEYAKIHSLAHPEVWAKIGFTLLTGAAGIGLATCISLPGVWRKHGLPVLAMMVMVALTLWSVPLTNGGADYAMRTLSPALLIGAALGGSALARFKALPVNCLLALVLLAATPFMLTVPYYQKVMSPGSWLGVATARHGLIPLHGPMLQGINQFPARVLTDNMRAGCLFAGSEVSCVPVWSPEVGFVFEEGLSPSEVRQRLRASGIQYVQISRVEGNRRFLTRYAFFQDFANWDLRYGDERNALFYLPE